MATKMDWFGPVVFEVGVCRTRHTAAVWAVAAAEMIAHA
jgi:hypothetical protein